MEEATKGLEHQPEYWNFKREICRWAKLHSQFRYHRSKTPARQPCMLQRTQGHNILRPIEGPPSEANFVTISIDPRIEYNGSTNHAAASSSTAARTP